MTAYGWWLPNDPRGSTSRTIASDVVAQLGALHYGRKKIQPPGRVIRAFYREARDALQHELLDFDGPAQHGAADGFARCIAERHYTCYAGVVMLDHTHLLIRKHRDAAEDMIYHLQQSASVVLKERQLRPLNHPVWAAGGWKVYLDEPDDFRRTIRYIEENPLPFHRPVQRWEWVTEYDGWPLRRRGW